MIEHSRPRFTLVAVSIGAIWLGAAASMVFSPDMVSGSNQEHLPLAAMTDWLWAALATGFVLLAAVRPVFDRAQWVGGAVSIVVIWLLVALVSIAGPQLVTGSDPTRIPLAAILSPIAALIATGYVALFIAVSTDVERSTQVPSLHAA